MGQRCKPCLTNFRLPQQPHTDSSETQTTATATAAAAAAMESSYSPLQLQDGIFLFDCESLLNKSLGPDAASDPGYSSGGSSLSPTSSVDSFCFSPTCLQATGTEHAPSDCFVFSSPAAPCSVPQTQSKLLSSATTSATKRSRSRYPGKKRQNASEREKLRMRDLTKALNHLRTYLPPSVAPAGQSLTKIETLRLTIRYISYLSAQLGLTEEALELRRSSGFMEQNQTLSQFLSQPASYSPQEANCHSVSPEQLATLQHSYQVPGGVCFSGEQHWTLQQQIHEVPFSGRC